MTPTVNEQLRDIATLYTEIGNIKRAMGDIAGATQAFTNALAIWTPLAAADPAHSYAAAINACTAAPHGDKK